MGREWGIHIISHTTWSQRCVAVLFVWRKEAECLPVVNVATNRVVRLLGKDEVVRWMNLLLYQGALAKKGLTTMVGMPCNSGFVLILTLTGNGGVGKPHLG